MHDFVLTTESGVKVEFEFMRDGCCFVNISASLDYASAILTRAQLTELRDKLTKYLDGATP